MAIRLLGPRSSGPSLLTSGLICAWTSWRSRPSRGTAWRAASAVRAGRSSQSAALLSAPAAAPAPFGQAALDDAQQRIDGGRRRQRLLHLRLPRGDEQAVGFELEGTQSRFCLEVRHRPSGRRRSRRARARRLLRRAHGAPPVVASRPSNAGRPSRARVRADDRPWPKRSCRVPVEQVRSSCSRVRSSRVRRHRGPLARARRARSARASSAPANGSSRTLVRADRWMRSSRHVRGPPWRRAHRRARRDDRPRLRGSRASPARWRRAPRRRRVRDYSNSNGPARPVSELQAERELIARRERRVMNPDSVRIVRRDHVNTDGLPPRGGWNPEGPKSKDFEPSSPSRSVGGYGGRPDLPHATGRLALSVRP